MKRFVYLVNPSRFLQFTASIARDRIIAKHRQAWQGFFLVTFTRGDVVMERIYHDPKKLQATANDLITALFSPQ